MKKILLGATALSIMGFAGAVSAQEWSVRTGGFMTLGLGYIDADEQINNIETSVVNNAEVIFNFRLVADNGITFGAKVEFEANGQSNNADEYVGFFEGSFGRVEVGAEDGAHDILVGGVPGGNFTSSADGGGFLFDYNKAININTQGNDTGDGLKVTYYTPTFSGFTAGISYSPDGREGGVASSNLTVNGATISRGEGVELGARYQNTFGDISFRLAGGYTSFLNDANADGEGGITRDDAYTIASSVGFAGFTLGAIYGVTNLDPNNVQSAAGAPDEISAFGVGVDYKTGPWFFGVQYGQVLDGFATANGSIRGATTSVGNFTGLSLEDSAGFNVEVNYALAPGVTVGAVGEYGMFDESVTINGRTLDDDAYAVGVFMGLNF